MIGNKKDSDDWTVSEEEGAKKMQDLKLNLFFEASAKSGEAINEIFKTIIEEILVKD